MSAVCVQARARVTVTVYGFYDSLGLYSRGRARTNFYCSAQLPAVLYKFARIKIYIRVGGTCEESDPRYSSLLAGFHRGT